MGFIVLKMPKRNVYFFWAFLLYVVYLKHLLLRRLSVNEKEIPRVLQ